MPRRERTSSSLVAIALLTQSIEIITKPIGLVVKPLSHIGERLELIFELVKFAT